MPRFFVFPDVATTSRFVSWQPILVIAPVADRCVVFAVGRAGKRTRCTASRSYGSRRTARLASERFLGLQGAEFDDFPRMARHRGRSQSAPRKRKAFSPPGSALPLSVPERAANPDDVGRPRALFACIWDGHYKLASGPGCGG